MRLNNPLYKNQGIHAISCIFTIENGRTKVLLIHKSSEPYKNKWILVGGAVYNNETVENALAREIEEKTGINECHLENFGIFSQLDRDPNIRMIALGYIGLLDSRRINLIKKSRNTDDCKWFDISEVPELGYDHNVILEEAISILRKKIVKTNFLKHFYPSTFTLPELHRTYEVLLNKEIDKRNFRRKIISLGLITDTKKTTSARSKKPAKLYKFKAKIKEKDIL